MLTLLYGTRGAREEIYRRIRRDTDENRRAYLIVPDQKALLAEGELAEVAVIEEYLPKQLSEEELTAELKKIIAEVGATDAKMMGKVMGVASKALAGRADGRAISTKVKELLGN